jgi:hypothetical protein
MITFKQLIESLIQYQFDSNLSESADGVSLTNIIFEEVSHETWEAIVEAIVDELSEETLEMVTEGSIRGSGTDRKAVLKKAYRAGEQNTRNFYANGDMDKPKRGDRGVTKAFKAGENSNNGSPAARGANRSVSQDRLKDTEHGRSEPVHRGGKKTYYSTQTHAKKMYAIDKPKLPK